MPIPDFQTIQTVMLSLGLLIIGALLHHWFTKSQEVAKNLLNLRAEVYSDFFKSFVDFSLNEDDKKQWEYRALLEDAHLRIVLYGHEKVVHETAQFWRSFQDGLLSYKDNEKQEEKIAEKLAEKLIPIVKAIRENDFKIKRTIPKSDIMLLLLWGDLIDKGKLPKY
ncbi:MAG: hypothetical protein AB1546_02335 [bacterium]